MTVHDLILQTGKSDAEIAVKVGAISHTVWRWRTGRGVPIPAFRAVLCRMAGVTVRDVTWTKQRITSPL